MHDQAALRDTIVSLVEALINMLDVIDVDPDMEADCDLEEEPDQDVVPWTLDRSEAAWC